MRSSLGLLPRAGCAALVCLAMLPAAPPAVASQRAEHDVLVGLSGIDAPWRVSDRTRTLRELVDEVAVLAGIEADLRVSEELAARQVSLPPGTRTARAVLEALRESLNLWYFVESPRRVVALEAYPISAVDSRPRPVRQVDAEYPQAQHEAGESGEVWLEGLVMADGTVDWLKVLDGPNPAFAEPALRSVRQWEFEPAVVDGAPVNAIAVFTVSFWLGEAGR